MGSGKVRSNIGITASSIELVLPGQAHINLIKTYLKDDDIIRPAIKYANSFRAQAERGAGRGGHLRPAGFGGALLLLPLLVATVGMYCPNCGAYVGECGHVSGGLAGPSTLSGKCCKCEHKYSVTSL
jgi:hypothetical protein